MPRSPVVPFSNAGALTGFIAPFCHVSVPKSASALAIISAAITLCNRFRGTGSRNARSENEFDIERFGLASGERLLFNAGARRVARRAAAVQRGDRTFDLALGPFDWSLGKRSGSAASRRHEFTSEVEKAIQLSLASRQNA